MRREVFFTEDALRDLEEIVAYVHEHDGQARADHVLNRLEDVCNDLAAYPERGSVPKELAALGVQEYRQVFFKPYRVICRCNARQVHIYVIADGRRDMQTLLTRRLFDA